MFAKHSRSGNPFGLEMARLRVCRGGECHSEQERGLAFLVHIKVKISKVDRSGHHPPSRTGT